MSKDDLDAFMRKQPASTTMSRRTFFLRLGSIALLGGALACDIKQQSTPTPAPTGFCCGPVKVPVVYSTEKKDWLTKVTDAFNKQYEGVYHVDLIDERGSLAAVEKIATGGYGANPPVAWSPASSLELHLLSARWLQNHSQDIIDYTGAYAPQSLVHSPLVFAVWKSRSDVLSNSPYNVIDWPDIHKILKLPGWAAIGGESYSNWGPVKFGHTQPDLSNSGLLTITLLAYASLSKQRDLAVGDISMSNSTFFNYFQDIEEQVYCFGPSSGTFMDTFIQRGPNQFDMITTYENLVLAKEPLALKHWEPLYMFYPSLNIISDHPFVILQGNGASSQQQSAAQQYLNFLLDGDQQRSALTHGFRSYNTSIDHPVAGNLFLNPPPFLQIKSENELTPLAQPPSGEVIDALINLWQTQKYGRQC